MVRRNEDIHQQRNVNLTEKPKQNSKLKNTVCEIKTFLDGINNTMITKKENRDSEDR